MGRSARKSPGAGSAFQQESNKLENAFLLARFQRNQLEREVKTPTNPNHTWRKLRLVPGHRHPENEKKDDQHAGPERGTGRLQKG